MAMFADVAWNDLYSLLQHSTTDWQIVNLLSRGSIAIIRLHNFGPIISEFTLFKCAIFAAIRPQFDDDHHHHHHHHHFIVNKA